jgi:hypothetical protein
LSNFERGQITDAHLAGAFVIKTTTLLGMSRIFSKVMSAYTDHGKTISAKREQWAKIITDRNRSSYTEEDFKKSHNYCSTRGLQQN